MIIAWDYAMHAPILRAYQPAEAIFTAFHVYTFHYLAYQKYLFLE